MSSRIAALPAAWEAAPELVAEIARWNGAGRLPARNGGIRALAAPARVQLGTAAGASPPAVGAWRRLADGGQAWTGEVRVTAAHRLRLHLADVTLPPEARLWVFGEALGGTSEIRGPFGIELLGPDGDLWTPSVAGPAIRLEVQLPPGERGDFVIDHALELFALDVSGAPIRATPAGTPSCLVDAQCIGPGTFDVIELVQRGVALIEFIDGGLGFFCSGGLLNDVVSSGTPFFLTANHCFDTQASATTLEAFWDYFTAACDGASPPLGSLPRSNGSLLLATGALGAGNSDYTLVRLSNLPANRVFLGWSSSPGSVPNGTLLHRISHPFGLPQRYSRNRVDTSAPTCGGAPRPTFLYSTFNAGLGDQGGTFGGSSGSPVLIAGGQVVGQLTGGCGPNPSDGCDYDNAEVDGAFSATFPGIQGHLAPSVIFTDGFESGDTSAWSLTVP